MSKVIGIQPETPPAPIDNPTSQIVYGCLVIPVLLTIGLGIAFFRLKGNASSELRVPDGELLLVRTAPDDTALLLARFGEERTISVTGRSEDWRWLEVELWNGRYGWAKRPLDIWIWQIDANITQPQPALAIDTRPAPIESSMISIGETTFTMGSPTGLGDVDETPPHPVTLSAFLIDKQEVTIAQYWECVTVGECTAPQGDDSPTESHYLNDPAFDNHPIINVPWADAKNYCNWLGKRLPTEAEWEMVAGWNAEQGAKSLWPWGNDGETAVANVGIHSAGEIMPVGSFPEDRSPAGVLDMGGNVQEWVLDWYKSDYYRIADETNPLGPTNRRGEGTGHVVRGASFLDSIGQARTANRRNEDGAYGYAAVGFRCAQDQ